MKRISKYTFIVLMITFFWTACGNEKITDGFDFDYFSAIDKESNKMSLMVGSRYFLKTRDLEKYQKKYGSNYKDSLLLPIVISISRNTLREYSAGDIYNYKRQEVEQKIGERVRVTLNSYNIEMINFYISSVKLPDELMRKLEKKHIERLKNNEKGDNKQ